MEGPAPVARPEDEPWTAPEGGGQEWDALLAALGGFGDAVAVLEGTRVVAASRAFADLTGYAREEIASPGLSWTRLFAPAAEQADPERFPTVNDGRSAHRLRRRDGRIIDVEVSAAPVDAAGLRRVAVLRDATARHALERMLIEQRDTYDALLAAQSRIGEGVALAQGSAPVEYANDTFARVVGRPLPEILGGNLTLADLLFPEDPERLREALDASVPGETLSIATRVRRRDGTPANVAMAIAPVRIRDAEYRLALVRDVTRELRDSEELEEARVRLAMTEKLAALGGLVSGVAHEIRTPLTIIANEARILQSLAAKSGVAGDGARLAEAAHAVAAATIANVERANDLVRGLRRFTRRTPTARERVDLAATVSEAVDLFAAANRGRTRIVQSLETGIEIVVNPVQLQQVVINLLENAADASIDRSDPLLVTTRRSEDGLVALLAVRDKGTGMTEETRRRIFEPLFTTKPDGMGLGLTIIRRIAEEHGAKVDCVSAPGEGTTMTVRLPIPPPE